eukprot:1157467-Pelagomonas_calceolata.AAC.14
MSAQIAASLMLGFGAITTVMDQRASNGWHRRVIHHLCGAGYVAFGCNDGQVGVFDVHTQNSVVYPIRCEFKGCLQACCENEAKHFSMHSAP